MVTWTTKCAVISFALLLPGFRCAIADQDGKVEVGNTGGSCCSGHSGESIAGVKTQQHAWYDVVGLTPSQKARIQPIEKSRDTRWDLYSAKIDKAQETLDRLMKDQSPRSGKMKVLVRTIANYQAEMQITKLESIIRIRQILNHDQRRRLNKWLEEEGGCGGAEEDTDSCSQSKQENPESSKSQ